MTDGKTSYLTITYSSIMGTPQRGKLTDTLVEEDNY